MVRRVEIPMLDQTKNEIESVGSRRPRDPLHSSTDTNCALTPTEPGTRLFLVQSGLRPDRKQKRVGARYGRRMVDEKLDDLPARVP